MPVFQPRTRVQILRKMIARVVSRSTLIGLVRNSVIFHSLAAAADEDAEQFFQIAQLRAIFSIDNAKGSDLDERAAEIAPDAGPRVGSTFATTTVTFSRTGTSGTLPIAAGSIVAAEDAAGQIKFRTTSASNIADTLSSVAGVPVVALVAGTRANVGAGDIKQLATRIPGIVSVVNPSAVSNAADRESDESFRARLKLYIQSLSRGTPTAIRAFVLRVKLTDGRRVLYAKVVEPVLPTGSYKVYVDDGTGSVDEYNSDYVVGLDTLISPAVGGEVNLFTAEKPIRNQDGSFALFKNSVLLVNGTDYKLNTASGQVELVTALTAGDVVEANYRYYIGLISESQRVVDGDPSAVLTYPGVRAAGTQAVVLPAASVSQTLVANAVVASDFSTSVVIDKVKAVLMRYLNSLDIGAPVVVAELTKRAMEVSGMEDFLISDLSGTFPASNQLILSHQVARIISANLQVV